MVGDNNTNTLAAESVESDTSELEILSVDLIPSEEELEMDADTYSLEGYSEEADSDATLQSDLRSRDERISSLQYDIEHLRSKWAGVEKELEAREELTEMLQSDLRSATKKLSAAERDLAKKEKSLDKVRGQLDKVKGDRDTIDEALKELRGDWDTLKADRDALQSSSDLLAEKIVDITAKSAVDSERADRLDAELESANEAIAVAEKTLLERTRKADEELADLRARVEGRESDWELQGEELKKLSDQAEEQRDRLIKKDRVIERIESNLSSIDSERGRLKAMLKVAQDENSDLRSWHSDAKKQLIQFTTVDRPHFEKTIEEQSGTIVVQDQEIKRLDGVATRLQRHSDDLREKLLRRDEASVSSLQDLEKQSDALAEATRTIASLEAELSETNSRAIDLEVELTELRDRQLRVEDLEIQLEQQAEQASDTSAELAGLRDRQETFDEISRRLEEESNLAAGLKIEVEELLERQKHFDELSAQLEQENALNDELRTEVHELKERQKDFDEISARLEEKSTAAAELDSEVQDLRKRQVTFDELTALLEEQAGHTSDLEAELVELRDQQVAFRELSEHATEQSTRLNELQSELAGYQERQQTFDETVTQLEEQLSVNTELDEELRELQENFAATTTDLKTELNDANDTITELKKARDELVSELVDSRSTKDDLTSRVAALETEIASSHQTGNDRIAALEASLEEANTTLASKEKAINALLNELADKCRSIDSIDEIESVVQEIDGRMSERIDDGKSEGRERVTRLLTGKVEGQDLRFPLFKDRLTLGRTANNDIQLRAQYVSRRHAVIFCENGVTRIVDWQSKNGVYVNKGRVSEQALENGDIITIGTAEFRYEERSRREAE